MWQIYHTGNNGDIDLGGEFFDTAAEAEERLEYLDEEEGYSSYGVLLKIKEIK